MDATRKKAYLYPLVIIGGLFFIFGFVTWAIAVLIPYLQIACELTSIQAMLVSSAFYISYFVMAIPSGYLLKKIGYKNALTFGLVSMAVGSLLFIPAAMTRIYAVFLLGLFVQGLGLSILQTASNPYVTILGPRESGARRMSIMGICNGVAGILGPLILGSIVLKDADGLTTALETMAIAEKTFLLDELARKVVVPYLLIAGLLLLVALAIHFSSLPEVVEEEEEELTSETPYSASKKSIVQFPHLMLGVFTLFIYVGVEVIAGNTIIGYGSFQGIAMSSAKLFTSMTLFFMLTGYVVGIIGIPRYFSQQQSLIFSSLLGILFIIASQLTSGFTSVLFIALLGLANSLMWPSIWPLAISDLGRFTKVGSSLLVMAISGGAVLPLIYERLADSLDARQAYWMVVPGYLIIALYALWGHKIRTKSS
ncbi:sugar MFS transporter [Dysgonomonadaceae bacterium zrk40]|nr:sugar MFS transporter [Dysgonomonadaceae bacterium zrk40]